MRAILAMILLAVPAALSAAEAAGLYEGRAIVTGMDGRSRPEGLRRILAQVLAKVAGNPALLEDPRVAHIDPMPLVRGFAYLDRMSDQPKRDEQGTRDRPYDLVVRFDAAEIDALLERLGDRAWPAPRPVLVVDIVVTPRNGPPMPILADTDRDERHRAALLDAADRYGLDLVLSTTDGGLPAPPGSSTLQGTLRWSEAALGWVGEWTLNRADASEHWAAHGVGFDAAYRSAIAGAAAAMSGHALRPR